MGDKKISDKYFQRQGNGQMKLFPNRIKGNNNFDLMIIFAFAWEIEKGDSNVKINDDFLKYFHNKPETYIYGKQVGGEVIIDGTPVYLADIGNLLYGYLGNRANFSYNHIKNNAANATKIKVGLTPEKVEKNEKDDRVLYNLGYEMANNYSNNQIITDILKDYLIKGTNEANKIRQEK